MTARFAIVDCHYELQSSEMAPEARVSLRQAEERAEAGEVESQETQVWVAYMHSVHGVGERSSSPVQPLEYDATVLQRQYLYYQQRPQKVNQAVAGSTDGSAKAKAKSKSTAAANPRARLRVAPHDKQNPAANATVQGKGPDSDSASAPNLDDNLPLPQPQPQARTTGAPSNRVFSSSSRTPSRHPSPSLPADSAKIDTFPRRSQPDASLSHPLNATGHTSPPIQPILPALRTLRSGDDHDDQDGNHEFPTSHDRPTLISRTYSRKGRRKKMDSSQSPTQSNDGRSYEQYLPRGDDLISSNPLEKERLSQQSHRTSTSNNEDITLHDDDTGAVNFHFSAEDSVPDQESRMHTSPNHLIGIPETPAPPRNPFRGSRSVLMASSQMFKATQFSSAFKPTFSPTSSRPSPDNTRPCNTMSPNSSPLKMVAEISPLQGAASSMPAYPVGLDTSPQQVEDDQEQEDNDEHEQDGDHFHLTYDDHTVAKPPKTFHGFPRKAPIEDYEPIHRSQPEELVQSGSQSGSDQEIEDEEDRRRQRVARKKAEVTRRLKKVGIERARLTEDAVVPSTKQDDEPQNSEARQYLDQCGGFSTRDSQDSVEDTQHPVDELQDIVQLSAGHSGDDEAPRRDATGPLANVSSNEAVVPNTDPGPTTSIPQTSERVAEAHGSIHADEIPETSPANLRPLGDMMPHSSDEVSKPGSFSSILQSQTAISSAGTGRHSVAIDRPRRSSQMRWSTTPSQPKNRTPTPEGPLAIGPRSEADADSSSIVVRSSPPAPAVSTRASLCGTSRSALATASSTSSAPPPRSISPLSKLTATPAMPGSDKTTTLTEESPRPGATPSSIDEAGSSPAVAKANRQKSTKTPKKSRASKTSKSFASNVSVSTDELARSPSNPTFEQSARFPRSARTSIRDSPTSHEISRGTTKMFAGMVFAISFQSKQAGEKEAHYNSRVALSEQITRKIKHAGGKVLMDGFDKLFEVSPAKNADGELSSTPNPDDDIELTPAAKEDGFTALIADGHSRKVKYMQALALGLPCIHERWVTTCLDKQRLVDWSNYLLCAGNSSFLGEAIRSRNLPIYDAATAKLSEVIQYRPRLLEQSRILLIMPRADETKKAAYVFLARVLGASLSRVYTVDEARKQLKAREDAGHPFDWVYVDEKMAARADLFSEPSSASKKRKRKSGVGAGPAPKRIRVLSNELVIQSLILGRLMEEDEMPTA